MRDFGEATQYRVEQYVPTAYGWDWGLVTCRGTYEDAVCAAGSWASIREAQVTVPLAMRVLDPDGVPVWDDIDTLEERRLRIDQRREKR